MYSLSTHLSQLNPSCAPPQIRIKVAQEESLIIEGGRHTTMEDWALWLGVVGVASFVAIQLSLLTTALEVAEMSSRGPYSNVPNVFTATNCAIGSIYAFCIRSPPLLLANFCGLIICFYCIMIFQANTSYGEGPVALDQTLWIFVGPTLLVMITLLLAVFDKTA